MAVAPSLVGFNVYTTSISVILNALSNPLSTNLIISTGTDGNTSVTLSSVGASNVGYTTITVLNLTPNTAYGIQMAAANSNSPPSTTTVQTITASTTTLSNAITLSSFTVYTTSVSITLGQNNNPLGTQIVISTGTNSNFAVAL